MLNLSADLTYAVRQFRHSPIFALTAVLTLAIGIGGTTAIFSLLHDVMLQSLPVADPAALYRIGSGTDCCVEGGPQNDWGMYSYPLFERLRAAAPEFEEMTAFQAWTGQFGVRRPNIDPAPRPLHGEYVTGNYFSVFGIRPFAGRFFTKSDDSPTASPVAVLSHRGWQTDWDGAHPSVGSVVYIEGKPFTIVGVAPPGFFGDTLRTDPPDFWLPLQQEPAIAGANTLVRQSVSAWLRAIGRLKPGVTTAGMPARFTTVLRQWIQHDSGYPAAWMGEIRRLLPQQKIDVVPAGDGIEEMRESYSGSLKILLAVCGLVLLIACANVANLLIARGMARRTQISIRLAMGASRSRLISQSLVESVLLAVIGGAVGLLVAYGAEKMIFALAFRGASYVPFSATPSLPVLAFAFGLSLLTGVIFGVAPAWFAARRDPVEALRGANRSTRDHSTLPQKSLLVLQAALSLVLVAGAAMLSRSLANQEGQDLGFRMDGLISVGVKPLPASYSPDRLDAIHRNLLDGLRRIPGVEHASLALYAPMESNWGELIYVDGHPPAQMNEKWVASWDRVSPDHFQTVGQPVLRGRGFTDADSKNTEDVAVVNETFVRRFFPGENPLDKHFGIDLPENARIFRIVGVMRDAKYTAASQPTRPMFFVPLAQWTTYKNEQMRQSDSRSHYIAAAMIRSRLKPGELEPILRKTFAAADPNLTVIDVHTLKEVLAGVFDQDRTVANLAGVFGAVALLLAAVGLYGVTAYSVAQRTSEIGIRMALGADSRGVLRLVLTSAFRMVGMGLIIGIPLAVGAGRLISSQLYGLKIWDPLSLSIAAGALALCAFVAAIIPAFRAASIDPITALRTD